MGERKQQTRDQEHKSKEFKINIYKLEKFWCFEKEEKADMDRDCVICGFLTLLCSYAQI